MVLGAPLLGIVAKVERMKRVLAERFSPVVKFFKSTKVFSLGKLLVVKIFFSLQFKHTHDTGNSLYTNECTPSLCWHLFV
mgnify:CR=1 FL=1